MSEDNKDNKPFSTRDWLSLAGVAGLFAAVVGWGTYNYEERLKEQAIDQEQHTQPRSDAVNSVEPE